MDYYKEIKEQIINNEITKRVKDYSKNRSDLNTYYNIGKLLYEAGKHYGEGIIKKYSIRLTAELGKKYSQTTFKYMRSFYLFSKSHSVSDELTYTHYRMLLPLKNSNAINYYIKISIHQNLSVRQLQERIKNKEYERLPEKTKKKLIEKKEVEVQDLIKSPIIIRNPNGVEVYKEKALQRLIVEDIAAFLEELGIGFTFIKNEYKIKIGNSYNYIDLLLFNYKYNCFVCVELKVTELKKEHIGQIEVYMNYIDRNVRSYNQDKTIGIIICKHNNKFIMGYFSDKRILSKEYKLA